jgi:adenylate cyclase
MEAPPLERKLAAILAADVEGYSRLMGIDEEGTLKTLSEFRAVTDELIGRHGGRICGTAGDSILAAFASALSAVHCAIDIQKDLGKLNDEQPSDQQMRFRIGINVGDVMVKDGDIFGDGVNIAARLEGLSDPGGICISRGIHDQVMKKLPYDFEDLGEQKVKNIAQPVRAFRLLLNAQMPPSGASPFNDPNGAPELEAALPKDGADLPSLSESAEGSAALDAQAVEIEFWDSIKDSKLAEEYEVYLQRYPDGNFAPLARVRLQAIAEDKAAMRDPKDRDIELAFWESVRSAGNVRLIETYLEKYPDGEFSALARALINILKGKQDGGNTPPPELQLKRLHRVEDEQASADDLRHARLRPDRLSAL